MSRSRRKKPIFGNTSSDSEKQDKVIYHRRFRRRVADAIRESVQSGDEATFPVADEVGNQWRWDKDGKTYWGDAPESEMRK